MTVVMWLEVVAFGTDSPERILEMPLMHKGGFTEEQGQNPRAERALQLWECEEQLILTLELGSRDKGSFQRDFHRLKTHRMLEA